MTPRRSVLAVLILCVLCVSVVSFSVCRREPARVVYDLAGRMAVAGRWSSREVVLFGTPGAEPQQAEGFYREAPGENERFLWSRGESEVSLTWPAPQARAAVLEMAPYRGVKQQSVEVRLNGAPVAHFGLNDTRHRYRLELPSQAQRAGENRLRFVFAQTASPSDQAGSLDRRQLAAAFYSLTVGPDGDAALEDLLRRDAPAPFAATETGGVPALVQVGPSVLRYALALPEDPVLRFTPELHPSARAAAASALLRVTVRGEGAQEREVWRGQVGTGSRRAEVAVDLPGRAGDVVELGLHVAGAGTERFAWVLWRAPRVMGRSAAALLADAGEPPPEPERARGLRERLRGSNVVLVVLDAARAGNLGAYGYPRPTTPEIDRIAADGVVFQRAYTPAVYTLGAMSSLWTSQYPDRHHAEVSYADRLPADRLTLAQALGGRGVHTAGFVANAMAGTLFGFDRGFAEFHEVYRAFPEVGSRAESFRRLLPQWLEANAQRPFFAYVHFREPHFPYDPPAPFPARFGPDAPLGVEQRRDRAWYTDVNQGRVKPTPAEVDHLRRLYDANLAYVDQEVGALRAALEQAGLWDRTVMLIMADHGEQLYEHGYVSHSAQVFEQSVHVPLVLRLPAGRGPRGQRLDGLVDLLDVAPTVLDVFGGPGDGEAARQFQGRSLLGLIEGGPGKPAVVSRTVWERPVYALRDARFKLVHDTRTGQSRLFDLSSDPGEERDLAAAQPLRAAWYRQSLLHWLGQLGEGAARAAGGGGGAAALTPEQCENLKTLGYIHAGCR
jgi:arylsulfatase A-like enzyme